MIVVQVSVKSECKIYGSHTGGKLAAKQLNILRFNR
jgi:hypothetical protein